MNLYQEISEILPYFQSIRKLKNYLSIDVQIPNTWKLIDAAQQFRQSLIREFRFLCIDQFKTKIFDEATVDCDIILMQNSKIAEYDVKIQLRNRNIIEFVNILSKNTLSKQQFFNFLLDENQLFLSDCGV
jgi:hypothetical protein